RGSAELAAVTAAHPKLLRLVTEDLTDKRSGAHCAAVSFADSHNLLDGIRRQPCADRTVGSQRGGRSDHRIDTVIRILQCSELSLQKDVLSFFQRLVQI